MWLPITHFNMKPNQWVQQIKSGWATTKDIQDTKGIVEWAKNVPLYAGYSNSMLTVYLWIPL